MEKSCRLCPKLFWLISIPIFILICFLTAITVIILLPFAYFGSGKVVRALLVAWAHVVFLSMGKRIRISGRQNVNKNKRYILLANHSSLFDILAIMAFYPGVSWFGREHLLKIPVLGRVLKMINYVPMKASDLRNTKQMIAKLTESSKGNTVAIFPEGTRTIDGQINDFKKGFLHLLRATELSILPVTLNGFYHFKPKDRFYINFLSPLRVVVHPPIHHQDISSKSDKEISEHVKEVIESAYL